MKGYRPKGSLFRTLPWVLSVVLAIILVVLTREATPILQGAQPWSPLVNPDTLQMRGRLFLVESILVSLCQPFLRHSFPSTVWPLRVLSALLLGCAVGVFFLEGATCTFGDKLLMIMGGGALLVPYLPHLAGVLRSHPARDIQS